MEPTVVTGRTERIKQKKHSKRSTKRNQSDWLNSRLYLRLMLYLFVLIVVFMYQSFTITMYPLNYIWVVLFLMVTIIGFVRGLLLSLISSMFVVFAYGSFILYNLYVARVIAMLELNDIFWLVAFPIGAIVSGLAGSEIIHLLKQYHSYKKLADEHVTVESVTGFPNERQFRYDLSTEISRTLRYGHSMTVMLLEIAYFNEMLKDYGKERTDQLLRQVSEQIEIVLRDEDTKGYLENGLFAMILPETPMDRADIIINRLDEQIRSVKFESPKGRKQIELQLRYGYSGCPDKYTTANELIADASRMLHVYAV